MGRETLLVLCSFERTGWAGGDNNGDWTGLVIFDNCVLRMTARLVNAVVAQKKTWRLWCCGCCRGRKTSSLRDQLQHQHQFETRRDA